MFPPNWNSFIQSNSLAGVEIEIPPEDDLTGLGAEMFLFNEKQSHQEASELYPGIIVIKDGFVPIAGCSLGSGDSYFIRRQDPDYGPVYRIYHDLVIDEKYDESKAIVMVLRDFRDLLKYRMED